MTPNEAYERLKQPRLSPADEAAGGDTLTTVVMTGLAVGLLAAFAVGCVPSGAALIVIYEEGMS